MEQIARYQSLQLDVLPEQLLLTHVIISRLPPLLARAPHQQASAETALRPALLALPPPMTEALHAKEAGLARASHDTTATALQTLRSAFHADDGRAAAESMGHNKRAYGLLSPPNLQAEENPPSQQRCLAGWADESAIATATATANPAHVHLHSKESAPHVKPLQPDDNAPDSAFGVHTDDEYRNHHMHLSHAPPAAPSGTDSLQGGEHDAETKQALAALMTLSERRPK